MIRVFYTVINKFKGNMNIKLNKKEKLSFISGCVFGDSHLYKNNNRCFQFKHSEKQLDYFLWKKSLLEKFFPDANIRISDGKSINKNTGKIYKWNGLFFTSDYFQRIYNHFYDNNGRKFLNFGRLNQLTPLGLAVWYMDDGSLIFHRNRYLKNGERTIRGRSMILATNCFNYEEHLEIKKWFKIRFNIEAKIYRQKEYNVIVLNATNSNRLIEVISPYIINSMFYKIDMKYTKSGYVAGNYSKN